MLSTEDQRALFTLGREAIRAHLLGEPAPDLPDGEAVGRVLGVFVTLREKENGRLRGCIGHTVGKLPLARGVRTLAVSAAFRDRRFKPMTISELGGVTIDLSVLSLLSEADPDRIEIGVHGLMIRQGDKAGLLLPQVASERGWTPEEFLQHTCRKAELPPDAWKEEDAELLWFTSTCYAEDDLPAT